MVRHYLNRKDLASPKDEWSYVSEIGERLELKNVMDVEDRFITFGKKLQAKRKKKMAPLEATKEGIRYALDAAGNTGQFIKFVNMTIDKRQTEINKIKKLKNKFDNEVDMLKSRKIEKLSYDKKELATLDVQKVNDYLNQLLLEKRITQSNLHNLKGELSSMEGDLRMQEVQIEEVRENIKAKISNVDTSKPENLSQAMEVIRKEISAISEKYDVSKLSEALNLLMYAKN